MCQCTINRDERHISALTLKWLWAEVEFVKQVVIRARGIIFQVEMARLACSIWAWAA
jgi:hypothetical protein